MTGQVYAVGGSVDLLCQIDKSLLENSLKVEWRRAETLVHLYEDGKIRAEEQHQDYHKRAHFLKKKIKDGNFSIRLKKLRAGDEGVYRCIVYKDQDCVFSADAQLILVFMAEPSHHTPVPPGASVVLPCYEDKPSRMENLKVEWRKKDLKDLVHLYQNSESRAEEQDEDYQKRAHFFTEHIKDGNLSLRLEKLRAEDEGEYTCTVHSGLLWNPRQSSTEINVVLKLLETVFRLQMFLVFCPNVLMFLAFVLWGVSEGSLFESVSCCALYFLRPLLLLWTAPYINNFTGNIKTWVKNYSYETEYIVFSAVFYSVLFKSAVDKSLNYAGFEGVMIIILFVIVILFTLFYIIYLLTDFTGKLSERITTIFVLLAGISFDVLPSLQFILLFFSFGSIKGGEFTFMNYSHSFMSNSARKHYSLFNITKIQSRKICGNFPVIYCFIHKH
uniref:Ig-like domain-containing protein n=1 Tax=Cyprinus carpio TaxID=7962 RepID=A0A8C1ZX20_CYPCA